MSKFVNPTKVITGVNTRWSYVNAWEPKSINGGAPKYSVSLIISKSDTKTIEKIQAAIQAAYEEGQGKLKGNGKSVPALSVLKTPCVTVTLRDRTMRRMRIPISSMPTAARRRGSWMQTGIRSLTVRRFIPECTAGRVSISTPSTATETRVSPAA